MEEIYSGEVMNREKDVEEVHLNIVYNLEKSTTMYLSLKYSTNIIFEDLDERNIILRSGTGSIKII